MTYFIVYLIYLMETVISASSIGLMHIQNLSDNQRFTTGPWKAYHGGGQS